MTMKRKDVLTSEQLADVIKRMEQAAKDAKPIPRQTIAERIEEWRKTQGEPPKP